MIKEPKKYECLSCGFKSSRSKTLRFPGIGFAICFKCRGRVKETVEWKDWYEKRMEEWRESVRENRSRKNGESHERTTTV